MSRSRETPAAVVSTDAVSSFQCTLVACFRTAATARADLQAAFDALLGAGNVQVIGPATAVAGSVYSLLFGGAFGNANLPQVFVRSITGTLTAATLTDGVAYNEVQSVRVGGTGNEVQSLIVTAGPFSITVPALVMVIGPV